MGNTWTAQSIPSLQGKTAIVTGANSGIGFHTALELGRAGAHVVVACRSRERGEAAVADMQKAAPGAAFELQLLDLASLADVRRFAQAFLDSGRPLDILVNNAGIMMPPYARTADGFESQLAANHLGHFALTGRLLPALEKSSAPRVVAVASLMAWKGKQYTPVDFVKSAEAYDPTLVYGESKLANLLFMRELGRRYPRITSVAAHPGGTATNLQKHKYSNLHCVMQDGSVGALSTLRAATEPDLPSGAYFGPRAFGWVGYPSPAYFPGAAKDDAFASLYWDASVTATGVTY